MYCPKCGHLNSNNAIVCQSSPCGWLLSNVVDLKSTKIAPDAHTASVSQKHPINDASQAPFNQTVSESLPEDGFSRRSVVHAHKRGSWRWVGAALIGSLVLATPIAYGAGYLASLGQIRHAITADQPPVVHHDTTKTYHPAKNPTHSVTPPGDQSQPSSQPATPSSATPTSSHAPVATTPKKTQAPVVKITYLHPSLPPGAMTTIRGTIRNGQLQTIVWAGASPTGPLYPVTLMVDTGAMHTMVSGHFWQAMGDQPTGATTTYAGIGGNETVGFWPHVYVYPQDKAMNAIIANVTEPGGINRSALGPEGVVILLGQDVIAQGTLTQSGTSWSLTYPVQ